MHAIGKPYLVLVWNSFFFFFLRKHGSLNFRSFWESVWLSSGESEFLTSDLLSYSVKTTHWSWVSRHMPLIPELSGFLGRSVCVWEQPGLHLEFQASWGYMVSLKVNKQTTGINLFFVKVKFSHFIKFLKQDLENVSLIHQYHSYFVLWQ